MYAFYFIIKEIYVQDVTIPVVGLTADITTGPKNVFILFLVSLYTLHVYWMYKFYEILYSMTIKKKYEDLIQPVHKEDDLKAK